ncbi:hypothetical protein DID80_00600 [Candidatus Marinamargulisbacteria bacterium SCGC AAA071-K20]|nr:hypothetical protein DID80_00600 [Candidatus Marinamargulisbacteria bacterium SCGC AAA071-K20]
MHFKSFLVILMSLTIPVFGGIQTIPIDKDVASLVTKEMSRVKPAKKYTKYEYRSSGKTKDLLTIITLQKKEIKSLQKNLRLSMFEIKKLEARVQVVENRMQQKYTYVEYK